MLGNFRSYGQLGEQPSPALVDRHHGQPQLGQRSRTKGAAAYQRRIGRREAERVAVNAAEERRIAEQAAEDKKKIAEQAPEDERRIAGQAAEDEWRIGDERRIAE